MIFEESASNHMWLQGECMGRVGRVELRGLRAAAVGLIKPRCWEYALPPVEWWRDALASRRRENVR